MFRPFSFFVGLRYTRAKRRNHFISFISFVSIGGIALGVTVLITVMSVMNGFERELRTRILGMAPHVIVTNRDNNVADWKSLQDTLKAQPGVLQTAPFVTAQGMFRYAGLNRFGLIQGVLPDQEQQVSIVGEHIVYGEFADLKPGEFGIVLGQVMADNFGARLGDQITIIIPEATTVGAAGVVPRQRRFTVVGTFEVRAEMDSSMAYVHMQDLQAMLRMGEGVSGIRLKIDQVLNAPLRAAEIRMNLPMEFYTTDWTRSYGPLFRAVKMEKTMMFVLLTFIIAVAAFNIISTLVMVVTDKQSDIAILRTLGASPRNIMAVFMVQGLINGLFGTILGLVGGIALSLNLADIVAWIEGLFGVVLMPSDVYFVGFLPSELEWGDVLNVGMTAFLMCLVSTLYPAWRASKVKPAEALRYE